MQFAPVANLAGYDRLEELGLLGSYHLLIATEVVKDVSAWENFWLVRGPVDGDPERFVIMDNGLIETGVPTDPQTLKEAADAVEATCIVLPDVLRDYHKTLKVVSAALPELQRTGYPLMGVVQGRTWEEVDYIVDFYQRVGVQFLSIPRVMVEIFGSRVPLVHRFRHRGMPIHLLGFSENMWDDVVSATMSGVIGLDSAVPLWYHTSLPERPPLNADFGRRPRDYWTTPGDAFNYDNVGKVRQWLIDALDARTQEERQGHVVTP